MREQKEHLLSFTNLCGFENKAVERKYIQWKQSARYAQISAATLLTSFLYVIYAVIDHYIAPEDVSGMMTGVHLYLIAPILLLIGLLAFWRTNYLLITILLMGAPIVAAIGNLLIVNDLVDYQTYLTEDYLIIFWIFTISGLKLLHATVSAAITFVIVFLVTYFFFSFSTELFVMHLFWMFSSFSFGFLGAFLIEKSSRTIFFNKEKLEQLAVTDNLTGLFNRTKLDEVLQNELDRSKRYKLNFGLVLLDIDYFKDVNDEFGHNEGDTVLVELSHIMKQHSRTTDILIRWGGEEFVIIYLATNKDELLALAESLRSDIENHLFERVGSKTASFGVTTYCEGDTMSSMLNRADRALYEAKDGGRNCVRYC